ncbi:hypothetical protein [Porphyromonas catoniae]|uniref:Uncharacterized protein n=1 Tax=Porphyromonas catoniae ATCC 51270 TaxID=887901 RepID=Z4WT90_9PORP|nr:hypothetical protein [Porphyromonas catoniae]EWC92047.1 hypothetical protein HMPREF0636_0909 [Porphyromonas catoniae ATCC 51270]
MNRYVLCLLLVLGLAVQERVFAQKVISLENMTLYHVLDRPDVSQGIYMEDTGCRLDKYTGTWEGTFKEYKIKAKISQQKKYQVQENPPVFQDRLLMQVRIFDRSGKAVPFISKVIEGEGGGDDLQVKRLAPNPMGAIVEESYKFQFTYGYTGYFLQGTLSNDLGTLSLAYYSAIVLDGSGWAPEFMPRAKEHWVLHRTSRVPPRPADWNPPYRGEYNNPGGGPPPKPGRPSQRP